MLTGELRATSTPSRTKLHADHAGLSPPSVPSRVLTPSRMEPSSTSQSSNSLIAPRRTRTLVAMVASWTMLSLTSRPTHQLPSLITHTLEETEFALRPPRRDSSQFNLSLMSQRVTKMLSLLLFPNNQSLLPLKLTDLPSSSTREVSSTELPADRTSTMVLLPLVSVLRAERSTSLSETHGVPHGESKATSELPRTTQSKVEFAVSLFQPHTQTRLSRLDLKTTNILQSNTYV